MSALPFRVTAAALGLTVAAAVTGCSSPDPTPSPTPPSAEAPLTSLLNQNDMDSQVVMNNAVNRALKDCMAKKGFPDFDPGPDLSQADPGSYTAYPPQIGLTDLTAPALAPAAPEKPAAEKPGQEEALMGPSNAPEVVVTGGNGERTTLRTAGCHAEAQNALWGSLDARKKQTLDLMEVRAALDRAGDTAMKDPAVTAGVEKWKSCMTAAGESAGDPASIGQNLPPGTTLAQWPTAQHDVACKKSSGLADAARDAYARAQRQIATENPGLLTPYRSDTATMQANAARILGTPSPGVTTG